MAILVVEFSRDGYKIRILRIGVFGRCQKVPKSDFQSQFSTSKIIQIFLFFFIEFRSTFFVIDKINF